jgi:hypothetical protein
MRVDAEHKDRCVGVTADFYKRMTEAGIDKGALSLALFTKAIIEMVNADGAAAVHQALRTYADAFDEHPPTSPPGPESDERGRRLAKHMLDAHQPELVVQFFMKTAAVTGINHFGPEWMARQFQIAAMEVPALALDITPAAGNA